VRFQRHHVAHVIGDRLLVLLLHVPAVLHHDSLSLLYSCRSAQSLRTSYAIPAIPVVQASAALIGGVMVARRVNRQSSA
jgi:hypothetical protein